MRRVPDVKVLMADDDRDLLAMARSLLWQVHGIEVDEARSAEAALEMVRRTGYDAMVVDQALPDLSGLEVLELLRVSGDDLPLVLLLAKDQGDLAPEALGCGASFCLRKSGDPTLLISELGNMVKVAVHMRRAENALLRGDESFWSLVTQSQDMIMIVDVNATACYVNPAGARLLGACEADLVGSSVLKSFHSQDVGQLTDAISASASSPGTPRKLSLRGRRRHRGHVSLDGEALSSDGRTVILYLADVGHRPAPEAVAGDVGHLHWEELGAEGRARRQGDLTRELTFRLISRLLVDRMSDSETSMARNRFRGMGGLAGPAVCREPQVPTDGPLEDFLPGDDGTMSQLIDRLALSIDLMEIERDARHLEEANRRFYGPD